MIYCYFIIEIIGSFLKGLQQDLPVNIWPFPTSVAANRKRRHSFFACCCASRQHTTTWSLWNLSRYMLIQNCRTLNRRWWLDRCGQGLSVSTLHSRFYTALQTRERLQSCCTDLQPLTAFIQETHILKTEASVDRSLWRLSKGLWTDLLQQQESSFAWVDSLETAHFLTGCVFIYLFIYLFICLFVYLLIYLYIYMLVTCSCNSQMEPIVIGASAKMGGHFGPVNEKEKGSEFESWSCSEEPLRTFHTWLLVSSDVYWYKMI